jgi:uncharacterized protein (DUF2141 family)
MPMLGINNIHDKDGKPLSTILEEIKKGVTGGSAVDLKDYAKASEVKEVKDMIKQLITDLKAGKYSVCSETTEVKEDKKNKETVKEEKVEK